MYIIPIGIVSIGLFVYCLKYFNILRWKTCILALVPLLISYALCSFIIFEPSTTKLINSKNLSSSKKAVIFYCDGEMEKYSPKYASYLLKDVNLLLKPFYAYKIKTDYKMLDSKKISSDILMLAKDVKNSLLNYKPYFFYIAFSSYFPNINSSIQSAINDGCKEITIIDYSRANIKINEADSKTLKAYGVILTITPAIYNTEGFSKALIDRVKNLSLMYDGILLIDNINTTSKKIKEGLISLGYTDKNVIITDNIQEGINYFKVNTLNNILYINLQASTASYKSEVLLPQIFEKYSEELKIFGYNSWGYDKALVKAIIENITK